MQTENRLVTTLGCNSYGLDKELGIDMKKTVADLAALGITYLEPPLIAVDNNPELQELLQKLLRRFRPDGTIQKSVWTLAELEGYLPIIREAGMEVPCCHLFHVIMSPDALTKMTPEVLAFAKRTGIKNYVISHMLATREACDRFLPAIRQAADRFAEEGLRLLYHNHETEFLPAEGAEGTLMDYLFANSGPNLKMQLDIGWAGRRMDTEALFAFVHTYRDRIVSLHLKDFREGEFAPVGTGDIPLKEVVRYALDEGCSVDEGLILIDQDEALTDMLTELKDGVERIFRWERQ